MNLQLTIGLYEGEITDVTTMWLTPDEVERHFSLGEVYAYAKEPQGMQWRVLQRGARKKYPGYANPGTYPALLPCEPKDVPEIVRLAALMHE